jgi:hypothetical protein
MRFFRTGVRGRRVYRTKTREVETRACVKERREENQNRSRTRLAYIQQTKTSRQMLRETKRTKFTKPENWQTGLVHNISIMGKTRT